MRNVSDKAKALYILILIFFISGFGILWMDYIGLFDLNEYTSIFREKPESVLNAADDEPSLIAREEFEKERMRLAERIENLDQREANLAEREKLYKEKEDELEQKKKGLELERKKLEAGKKEYSGYKRNVKVLADKISNMPPEDSVKIMVNWEDPLIIDVIRQMDTDAETAGRASITSYLITLMPKQKASRIMELMTKY